MVSPREKKKKKEKTQEEVQRFLTCFFDLKREKSDAIWNRPKVERVSPKQDHSTSKWEHPQNEGKEDTSMYAKKKKLRCTEENPWDTLHTGLEGIFRKGAKGRFGLGDMGERAIPTKKGEIR